MDGMRKAVRHPPEAPKPPAACIGLGIGWAHLWWLIEIMQRSAEHEKLDRRSDGSDTSSDISSSGWSLVAFALG